MSELLGVKQTKQGDWLDCGVTRLVVEVFLPGLEIGALDFLVRTTSVRKFMGGMGSVDGVVGVVVGGNIDTCG